MSEPEASEPMTQQPLSGAGAGGTDPMSDLTLDGNALGGFFLEIFGVEMTAVAASCQGCGAVEAVGALLVYDRGPGTVVRCPHCAFVLLRVVRTNDRYLVDMRGLRWLEVPFSSVA